MQDSIFYSFIRTFLVTLGKCAAYTLALLFFLALIVSAFSTIENTTELHYSYTPRILPNAAGIRKSMSAHTPVILRLNITGPIGTKCLNRETIAQQLVESREKSLADDRVKALLLYIDSPGGTQTDSDAIYRLIKEYKKRYGVPVYAYVDGLCASGGIYVACAADQIYSSATSIVGSVGVIASSFVNVSTLMEKIGISSLTVYEGKGKDNLNPLRPWSPDEDANLKHVIDILYNDFVNIVVSNRPRVDKERLIHEYGAQIYVAPQAQEIGFIDASGVSYEDTLRLLVNSIGIHNEEYQVVELEKETWITELLNENNSLLTKGEVKHSLALPSEIEMALQSKFLYYYHP